ncbi:MAG TPA: 2-C-methyl-D-erythritol 2,4-cyclodiphosphate synthase [Pyrinomonadaceae bacterium]|jgi:2-C-methyl-D-erythritol 2,4-cyclodiphosphate synthase
MFRIGIGNDIHRLVEGRKLFLGGVRVKFDKGAEGHSDADTLLHAITDALLGALALGDLGVHFPDSDPQWKDANSKQLLAHATQLAFDRGFSVVNVDATIMLERPQLRRYILSMRKNIASVLGVELSRVSVKAKTAEGLDAVGQGLAVSAKAIVLLEA